MSDDPKMWTDEFTQPMTDDELDAIKQRLEDVTPGPWRWGDWNTVFGEWENENTRNVLERGEFYCGDFYKHGGDGIVRRMKGVDMTTTYILGAEEDAETDIEKANRRFIAHARTDVPRLLAEVERQRNRVDELERLLDINKGR